MVPLKVARKSVAVMLVCCISVALSTHAKVRPVAWDRDAILSKESIPPGEQFDWARKLTFPGAGEWKPIFLAADGSEINFASLRGSSRRGEKARVWVRVEQRSRQQPQSFATFVEFDCEDHTMKLISQRQFSESDMRGELRTINAPNIAEPILPGTAAETWLDWACKATAPKETKDGNAGEPRT
jgi:hypothetical protein